MAIDGTLLRKLQDSTAVYPRTRASSVSVGDSESLEERLGTIQSTLTTSIANINTRLSNTPTITGSVSPSHVVVFNNDISICDSGYTIASNVPANAVFTDTTYPMSTRTVDGIMSHNQAAKLEDMYDSKDVAIDKINDFIDPKLSEIEANVSVLDNRVDSIYNTVSTKANKSTTASGYGITDVYTKIEVDNKLSSALEYKGSLDSYSVLLDLVNINYTPKIGDVWNLKTAGGQDSTNIFIKAGDNVAYNGTGWDVLGGTTDLSGYVLKTTKVNGKELSGDITLSPSDVGALDALGTAVKATADAEGHDIVATYATKENLRLEVVDTCTNAATTATEQAEIATTKANEASKYKDNAQTYAQNASISASKASASASAASGYMTSAESYMNSAEGYMNSASEQASKASTQASNASTSASNASKSATSASTYASNAKSSADSAASSLASAQTLVTGLTALDVTATTAFTSAGLL